MILLICILDGIILRMMEFVIQWRKFVLIFQDLFNRAGPTEVTWRDADTWRGHASPHGCLRGAYVA